jgi:drug/metabolite transporter superfamily protein YnfA
MLHTGFFIAIAILPALWLLPLVVLFPLMYYETVRSGPLLRVHLPLNAAFLAWSVYAVYVLHEGLHSTNSPLIVVPRLLVLAVFYAIAIPRLVENPATRRVFRYAVAGCYVVAFLVLCATADWDRAFGRGA